MICFGWWKLYWKTFFGLWDLPIFYAIFSEESSLNSQRSSFWQWYAFWRHAHLEKMRTSTTCFKIHHLVNSNKNVLGLSLRSVEGILKNVWNWSWFNQHRYPHQIFHEYTTPRLSVISVDLLDFNWTLRRGSIFGAMTVLRDGRSTEILINENGARKIGRQFTELIFEALFR